METWEKLLLGLGFAVLLFLIGGTGIVVAESVAADGKTQYCYIESQIASDMQMWRLYGFRPWRPDRHMGTFTSFEAAVAAAQSLECKVATR